MKAYLNDKILKSKVISEIKKHQETDAIIQGTYGREEEGQWKGCAVGCTLKSLNIINSKNGSTENHKRLENELGWPEELAYLEDKIFEMLPVEDAKKWPLKFAKTISVGSDLSMVTTNFKIWLLDHDNDTYKNAFDDGKKAIDMVVDCLKSFLLGSTDEAAKSAAASAESAAESAAASAKSAAWSAAESAAASAESAAESAAASAKSAAWSAAESAAWSAESAAWSAAASAKSAAWSAAESAWSASAQKQAKKLLGLLKEAK